jgi:hypothetical protein
MIRNYLCAAMFFFTVYAHGETKSFDLNPKFLSSEKITFLKYNATDSYGLKGTLLGAGGKTYDLPSRCEPEGGNPDVLNAFTVESSGKTVLVYVCAWAIDHSGLGLKGVYYQGFAYGINVAGKPEEIDFMSKAISGYEGSNEEGGRGYFFYYNPKILLQKVKLLASGADSDSLILAHDVILDRLSNLDYDGISYYMSKSRLASLLKLYPMSQSNSVIYNDIGYALGQAGHYAESYDILKKVEVVSPERVVLKLNIADTLWVSNKIEAKRYYIAYISAMKAAGKESKIPPEVFVRSK